MRERIRGYFGDHALCELSLPMMLCFADSATLSHSTKERNYEHLQLFRGNISSREDLPALRRAAVIPEQAQRILVPRVLRPGLTTES